jgi:hypothetical protein
MLYLLQKKWKILWKTLKKIEDKHNYVLKLIRFKIEVFSTHFDYLFLFKNKFLFCKFFSVKIIVFL